MPNVLNFYIDDSGTRHPDRHPGHSDHNDWFALGGVLIRESDEGDPRIRHERFCHELERVLLPIHVLGLACVIDRPGYNARYEEKYGRMRWSLCKSAFSI